ncbi:hypothetical protein BRADI_1g74541v3 [Brachypodium distachyon]|uniref:Uncharacterized protein n=1 Tax=Brachypodium distachyon TaxID=15368 RepID=A0A2K2DV55_BRADI|nr:hypothetical protein BRADI_1g74541v3 [Brachypodium distachyon]
MGIAECKCSGGLKDPIQSIVFDPGDPIGSGMMGFLGGLVALVQRSQGGFVDQWQSSKFNTQLTPAPSSSMLNHHPIRSKTFSPLSNLGWRR